MEPNDKIEQRILDESDDDLNIHAIYHTGTGDENIEYYLVVAQKTYEGNEMLKVRYFALHPKTPAKDTWMQNGINIRDADEFAENFAIDFNAIHKGATDGDMTITREMTEE